MQRPRRRERPEAVEARLKTTTALCAWLFASCESVVKSDLAFGQRRKHPFGDTVNQRFDGFVQRDGNRRSYFLRINHNN
jgi:hypothetical protein